MEFQFRVVLLNYTYLHYCVFNFSSIAASWYTLPVLLILGGWIFVTICWV